jgi:glycosyltransferase involved in cell wall biosynthesis
MRVLYPIGSLYPAQTGGPSNSVYWIAKELTKLDVDVTIVTTDLDIKPGAVAKDKWIATSYGKVRYCTTRWHYFPAALLVHSLRSLWKADVVHLTALFYPPSLIIGMVALFFGKKLIWSVRGELHPAALQYNGVAKKLYVLLIKHLFNKATFHATSTTEELLVKQQMGTGCNVRNIPNFIELPPRQINAGFNYLLYVGRLHPIKSLDKLLDALSVSSEFKHTSFELVLAGDGDKNYVEELASNVCSNGLSGKVRFIGNICGEEKEKLFANAKVTFLVSETENFGNVIVESLAHGTPVICSTGTPWRIVAEKQAGYWVLNDPVSIASAIDNLLLADDVAYFNMRRNAQTLAASNFDIRTKAPIWLSVYAGE